MSGVSDQAGAGREAGSAGPEAQASDAFAEQAATARILRAIAGDAGDLHSALHAIAEAAAALCDASDATIFQRRGGELARVAHWGPGPAAFERAPLGRGGAAGRAVIDRRPFHVHDLSANADDCPEDARTAARPGCRTSLGAPLMRAGEAIGAITVRRVETRPFTEPQIATLGRLADLAAIADELGRLREAERAGAAELRRALHQRTATAEVLKTISRSAFDLGAVLRTLTASAARLCEADMMAILRREGGEWRYVAEWGMTASEYALLRSVPHAPGLGSCVGRVLLTGATVHIADVRGDPDYALGWLVEQVGIRSMLGVPMLRDGAPIGVLVLLRKTVRPFARAEIDLVETFADQAVIAVENARLFAEVRARTIEVEQALEHQTATAEVLGVISRSPSAVEPVLDAIVATAARLCGTELAMVFLVRDGACRLVAVDNIEAEFADYVRAHPLSLDRTTISARAVIDGRTVHVADVLEDPDYDAWALQRVGGYRTVLAVPLIREGKAIGVITAMRRETRRFTEAQIELVETFADQAVIAVENARLFAEVRERTEQLQRALDEQTATAEILRAIAAHPADRDLALRSVASAAAQVCEAYDAAVMLVRGDSLDFVAHHGPIPVDFAGFAISRGWVAGRAVVDRCVVHVRDLAAEDVEFPDGAVMARRIGHRTTLAAPLIRDGVALGAILLRRFEVAPFTDAQIATLRTFADQAVIAIENARLFAEVRARTAELQRALEHQSGASAVLGRIARAPAQGRAALGPVLEAIRRLCRADFAHLFLKGEDGLYRLAAADPEKPEYLAFFRDRAIAPDRGTMTGRAVLERRTVHVEDTAADPEYTLADWVRLSGTRTALGAPLLRDGEPIGVIGASRAKAEPFDRAEIDLIETFADQAVIAIENGRLFDEVQARTREVQEALEQQTATSEILRAISTAMTDAQPVFDTIVRNAVTLCGSLFANVFLFDGEYLHFVASHNVGPGDVALLRGKYPMRPDRSQVSGRVILGKTVVRLEDATAEPDYDQTFPAAMGWRQMLGVPMLRDGASIGAIVVGWAEAGAIPQRKEELLETFADQAVIAIENARLFEQVQARTRELSASLDELRTTQDRLVQTEKLASLGQLTAGIAHEIKNPLNFVNNFSQLSVELVDELLEAVGDPPPGRREDIAEIADMLRGNLARVVEHGRRADSIVRNMLLHSRSGVGERRRADINALVEESLNLAFHGARAESPGFTVAIDRALDPAAGAADVYPQEITRALLNVITNGFHAAARRPDGPGSPTLRAATRDLGDRVVIEIRDNGAGVAPAVRDRMFNPFFTTKPPGEGTGLGLSITHDIVITQHGGAIEVETEEGVFTEFRIILPRAAAKGGGG